MTSDHKNIYKVIDQILWDDWDPIGINDMAPRDEYHGYIPQIFSLKINGADIETIAQKLNEMATNNMGLESNMTHCREVATKIFNLK